MTDNVSRQSAEPQTHEALPPPAKSFYISYGKRALDVCLCGAAVLCLSPVYLVIALLELRHHGRPVLYATERPGRDGQLFKLYKFRSMTAATDADGTLLPEAERLTRFGRILRRTSLDELPELFNILRGEMSIIGPRPLLTEYLPLYSARHALRHSVRPGLACVPVDRKPGEWTWGDQFENDIYYVENVSLSLDVRMLWAVLRAAVAGSESRSMDTRVRFTGDNLYETRSKDQLARGGEGGA